MRRVTRLDQLAVPPGNRLEALAGDGTGQYSIRINDRYRIGVSYVRLNAIVNGRRGVTPNTALRLEQATGMDADFWLGLQADWDLWHELRSPEAKEIEKIERLPNLAA